MNWMWWRRHSTAPGVEAINAWSFPINARRQLVERHPTRGPTEHALVEAAARQWFRIVAANPGTRFAMPSTAVDELWHETILHTNEYAAFCDEALGRFLHHQPGVATDPRRTDDRATGLVAALRAARRDEDCSDQHLPLLFRVDECVALADGRRYMADCGGTGSCFRPPRFTCMRHPGIQKRTSTGWAGSSAAKAASAAAWTTPPPTVVATAAVAAVAAVAAARRPPFVVVTSAPLRARRTTVAADWAAAVSPAVDRAVRRPACTPRRSA